MNSCIQFIYNKRRGPSPHKISTNDRSDAAYGIRLILMGCHGNEELVVEAPNKTLDLHPLSGNQMQTKPRQLCKPDVILRHRHPSLAEPLKLCSPSTPHAHRHESIQKSSAELLPCPRSCAYWPLSPLRLVPGESHITLKFKGG